MKRNLFLCILISVLLLVSCNGDSPQAPVHVHDFDEVNQRCYDCGEINKDVVAFIGDSFNSASARFVSLQKAVDYVKANSKKAIGKQSTVHSYGSQINCEGVVIDNVDIAFDFTDTTVTFTSGTGIVINGGTVEIKGKALDKGSNNKSLIVLNGGSLSTQINFGGSIELNNNSKLSIVSGNVSLDEIKSNNPDNHNISVKNASVTVSLQASEQLKNHTTSSSNFVPAIAGHDKHSFVTVSEKSTSPTCTEAGELYWHCSECDWSYMERVPAKGHNYNQEVANPQYLKKEATYTTKAVYYKSCECGAKGTATFEYGQVLPPPKQVTVSIQYESEGVTPGENLVLSVKSISETVPDSSISWYVDGVKQSTSGTSFTFKTSPDVRRYVIYAQVSDIGHTGKSNELTCYGTDELALTKVIYKTIDDYGYTPGLSVSVYSKSKNLDFNMYTGYSSIKSKTVNTKDTTHVLCSITKSFTAACIVKLAQEGKISLTDTISDYLSTATDALDEKKINMNATIEQLLLHTSGIDDYIGVDLVLNIAAKQYLALDIMGYSYPFRNWKPQDILKFIMSDYDLERGYKYSTGNYVLLGMIIEKVTGKKYNTYLRENFLVPLGIESLRVIPQDFKSDRDYASMTSFHIDLDNYSDYFEQYSDILNLVLPILGIDIKKGGLIDIKDVANDAGKLLGMASWAGGGIAGTSDCVSRWGYNLFSTDGGVDSSIREVMLDSVAVYNQNNKFNDCRGYGIQKIFHANDTFVGHVGMGCGNVNNMYYNETLDVCFAVLSDCSEGIIDVTDLIFDLYDTLIDEWS